MPIIPRWEWRTFRKDLSTYAGTLKKFGEPNVKKSEEYYILSQASDENVKIREDLIDIKCLKEVNADKLEQWDPIMKTEFPVSSQKLQEIFQVFHVRYSELKRKEYTYQEFIEELIAPHPQLTIVNVKKVRYIYKINDCAVELAMTDFNGVPFQTACVEHIDPKIVMSTVKELGLMGFDNINYVKAMKKSVGMA